MTESTPTPPRRRSGAERASDHEEIARLADTLVPALAARLVASGLGELEVREDDWLIRLRRPAGAAHGPGRRGDRGRGAMPAAVHPAFPDLARQPRDDGPGGEDGVREPALDGGAGDAEHGRRVVATAPAVGIFRPEAPIGTRVRAGDRLGVVDLLGIPQEVASPTDGMVVDVFVEAGDAVEYGEPVIVVEAGPGEA